MIAIVIGLCLTQISDLDDVTIDVNGIKRQFYIYFPKTNDAKPLPVVFAFHGHGGNSRYSVNKFKVNKLWPEAISVYMQGLPTVGQLTDPKGEKNGWQGKAGDFEDRDLKFFDAVLKWVHTKAAVNDKQIFSLGHSNGGGFTYLLWNTHPDTFAAIAPFCAGGLAARGIKPIPVFHVSGQNDPLVKFAMQSRTVDYIRKLDQCAPEGQKIGERMTRYESNVNAPMVWYVHDGGHELPEDALTEAINFLKIFAKD
jgi:polyhydroxybutyrate depolymerase